jgi:hypothetical protein
MTLKEKLEFNAKCILNQCTTRTNTLYQKSIIPFLLSLEKENCKVLEGLHLLKSLREFTFMGYGWEESLEFLHSRSEYLESLQEKTSPQMVAASIRSKNEELVTKELVSLIDTFQPDEHVTELLHYINR